MSADVRISKDIDRRIHSIAREYYAELRKSGADKGGEISQMVSGKLDDGTASSLVVKIRPNPINPRLSHGWKVVAEDRVWEIPPAEMEKSRLL